MLILGRGKTGSLVAELARERRHHVRVLGASENQEACGLTEPALSDVELVIDFTTPVAVLANIRCCLAARKNMVVGTTGWYGDLAAVRQQVEKAGTGLVYGANFSIGVNLFFEAVRVAAEAVRHEYLGQIFERHHKQKKDAPSGTALVLQSIVKTAAATQLEITSFREGHVVGMHEVVFDSANDRIYLCHDAKSRRGYAEGAVRAAEWLAAKRGFYEFREIWREL